RAGRGVPAPGLGGERAPAAPGGAADRPVPARREGGGLGARSFGPRKRGPTTTARTGAHVCILSPLMVFCWATAPAAVTLSAVGPLQFCPPVGGFLVLLQRRISGRLLLAAVAALAVLALRYAPGQSDEKPTAAPSPSLNPDWVQALSWRPIGPASMGGR